MANFIHKRDKIRGFIKEFELNDRPMLDCAFKILDDYIIVKPMSNDNDFTNDKFVKFEIRYKEYEDSSLIITFKLDDNNDLDIEVLNVDSDNPEEYVNVFENNTNYYRYYGINKFKINNKWHSYIRCNGIIEDVFNEFSLNIPVGRIFPFVGYKLLIKYISEKISLYGNKDYIYGTLVSTVENFNGSKFDNVFTMFRRTNDIKILPKDYKYAKYNTYEDIMQFTKITEFYDSTLYDGNDAIMLEIFDDIFIDLFDVKSTAIKESFELYHDSIYRRPDFGKHSLVTFKLIYEIRTNKKFFKELAKKFISIYKNHNLLAEYAYEVFLPMISSVAYGADNYKEFVYENFLFEISRFDRLKPISNNMRYTLDRNTYNHAGINFIKDNSVIKGPDVDVSSSYGYIEREDSTFIYEGFSYDKVSDVLKSVKDLGRVKIMFKLLDDESCHPIGILGDDNKFYQFDNMTYILNIFEYEKDSENGQGDLRYVGIR